MGDIVSHEGVKVPKTLRNMRGFLSLIGYYHVFVQNYERIEAPPPKLTKKNALSLSWNPKVSQAFEKLEQAMCKDLLNDLYCGM